MRPNLKLIILVFVGVTLFGAGSVFASPPSPSAGALGMDNSAYMAARASTLLAEIKMETAALSPHANTLGTFARNPEYSWQSHAFYLDQVKGHINAIGERIAELQEIRYGILPWQEQAMIEVTSHAEQVAASTQAAIVYLNENQGRHFVPEYRDHLTAIADSSDDMKQAVVRFLDYDNTQQKLQDLQNKLALGG